MMTYKQKLFLHFFLVFALFAAGILLFERLNEKRLKTEALKEQLNAYAEIAGGAIAAKGEAAASEIEALFPPNLRFTLIDDAGNVLYDNVLNEKSENHANRPEIRAASSEGTGSDIRISASNHIEYLYFARHFVRHSGSYYIRVALPYDLRLRHILQPDNVFLYFILGIFLLILLLINYLVRKIAENILADQTKNRLLKQEMTGNIAHELRTPVTGIRGYLETVLNNPLDRDKERYFIERAYRQTLAISDLIRDMSLITKIEQAPQTFSLEPVNIAELLSEVKNDLEIPLQEKTMTMEWIVPPSAVVEGNRNLLYSVFRNLTENAIRYAGVGSTIVVKQTGEDSRWLYFSFADNGAGVPEKYLSRLFERFYRVDEGRTRDSGGSGLGLSIVRNAIAFHQGTVVAKNRAGEGGLEFLFSLPKK